MSEPPSASSRRMSQRVVLLMQVRTASKGRVGAAAPGGSGMRKGCHAGLIGGKPRVYWRLPKAVAFQIVP
jgi:hypothetical protein